MKTTLHTHAAIAANFAARYPVSAGKLESLAASGDLDQVQAAGFRPFNPSATALQVVKAIEHFYVSGVAILKGELVEVEESVARRLLANGQAEPTTDAEVAAAQAPAAAKKG